MTERERFEAAWNKRPWLVEEEADKDRAWRWWQAALAPAAEETRPTLPGHSETVAGLRSLTIRECPTCRRRWNGKVECDLPTCSLLPLPHS